MADNTPMTRWGQALAYLRGGEKPGLPFLPPMSREEVEERVVRLRKNYAALRGDVGTAPEISVVIPVHFQEQANVFLGALQSIVDGEDVPSTEIIVVLNGPASDEDLRRTELFRLGTGIGLSVLVISYLDNPEYRDICRPASIFVPKQKGLDAAAGRIVLGADIDSVMSSRWLRTYLDRFRADENLAAAYGPVHLQCDGRRGSRLMTRVSTLVKSGKILLDRPPFAGHNHALRKSVADRVPDLYGHIVEDCQELPAILKSRLGLQGPLTEIVPCIPGAVSTTEFAPQPGLWGWLMSSAQRNVRNLKRIRTMLRVGSPYIERTRRAGPSGEGENT